MTKFYIYLIDTGTTGDIEPTVEPTLEPTAEEPTDEPTVEEPTVESTAEPTGEPTLEPTVEPTEEPTEEPTAEPTEEPTVEPTEEPATDEPASDLGVVTIGTNAEYPPFEFVDEDGNIQGFDYDLVTAIAERAGFEPEFVNTRWDGIFFFFSSGEFDAVSSAATITEEREEIVDFSNPYFNAGQMIAVREAHGA